MQTNHTNYLCPLDYWPIQLPNYFPSPPFPHIQPIFQPTYQTQAYQPQIAYFYPAQPSLPFQSHQPMASRTDPPQNIEVREVEETGKQSNRNMISNSLKVFRKYIKDSIAMGQPFIQKIISRYELEYSAQQFLNNLNRLIPQKRNYYGSKFINTLINTGNNDSNFNIVLRSALLQYYRLSIFPTVLNSRKIMGKCKKVQLLAGRKIIKELINQ